MDTDTKIKVATSLVSVIDNVEIPMLMYKNEKDVVKEALELYIKYTQESQ